MSKESDNFVCIYGRAHEKTNNRLFIHVVNTELGSVTSILISPDIIKYNLQCGNAMVLKFNLFILLAENPRNTTCQDLQNQKVCFDINIHF